MFSRGGTGPCGGNSVQAQPCFWRGWARPRSGPRPPAAAMRGGTDRGVHPCAARRRSRRPASALRSAQLAVRRRWGRGVSRMAQKGRVGGRQTYRSDRKAAAPRPVRAAPVDVAPIRAVVEQAVTGEGYEVDSVSVKPVGRRHLVRVTIDGDGGLGLDVIADVSRAISAALDAAEETGKQLIDGEYQLEGSSPGVDRPLTTPAHWRRNIGRLVKVKAGERVHTGRVVT